MHKDFSFFKFFYYYYGIYCSLKVDEVGLIPGLPVRVIGAIVRICLVPVSGVCGRMVRRHLVWFRTLAGFTLIM